MAQTLWRKWHWYSESVKNVWRFKVGGQLIKLGCEYKGDFWELLCQSTRNHRERSHFYWFKTINYFYFKVKQLERVLDKNYHYFKSKTVRKNLGQKLLLLLLLMSGAVKAFFYGLLLYSVLNTVLPMPTSERADNKQVWKISMNIKSTDGCSGG